MCTHPFAKKALTLHLARSEGYERYFGCNLMHSKVLASSHQHLMAEAPYEWLDPPSPGRESFERVTVNGTALVRANVKALIEYQRNIGGAEVDDYMFLWRLRFSF